jgi:hypothetical protein
MSPSAWKRMLWLNFGLAGGGILACVAALLDFFVATGSILGFFATTVPLGLAVIAVLFGFLKACDKAEEYLDTRTDRLLGMRTPPSFKESHKWT